MRKMLDYMKDLPINYREDVKKAIDILKKEGCSHIYLFGSLAKGNISNKSDIDLAIKGCPTGKYFNLIGKLLLQLSHSVDLVDLDKDKDFAHFLRKEGDLVNVS